MHIAHLAVIDDLVLVMVGDRIACVLLLCLLDCVLADRLYGRPAAHHISRLHKWQASRFIPIGYYKY